MKLAVLIPALAALPVSAQYSVQRDGDVVRLMDAAAQTAVSVLPPAGNIAFEMQVKGVNVLRFPFASLEEFRKRPGLNAIPFMGPWANRLDEQAFYANGKKYNFDMELGNVRGKIPIHGFLTGTSEWRVVEARADNQSAWVTSRLEFYRQPAWMKQWPFAHTIDITYRLQGGVLEVQTRIENLSAEPMPVVIGYHPYFQLSDSKRDEWTVSLGARTEWLLAPEKVPTGETRPIEQLFPNPQSIPLKDYDLDHVFGDLVRDPAGRATMTVQGKSQRLDVVFGPNYRAAVIYAPRPAAAPPQGAPGRGGAPQDRNFICFEPMVGITNATNLAHKGVYKELQSVAPGGVWQESFWIRPSGF
ncbi:MAG: aldose 1-epimerase [Bryobacterales bacterium]|nr:aldose 1-epimerase [Bryobacterales bacterium]